MRLGTATMLGRLHDGCSRGVHVGSKGVIRYEIGEDAWQFDRGGLSKHGMKGRSVEGGRLRCVQRGAGKKSTHASWSFPHACPVVRAMLLSIEHPPEMLNGTTSSIYRLYSRRSEWKEQHHPCYPYIHPSIHKSPSSLSPPRSTSILPHLLTAPSA